MLPALDGFRAIAILAIVLYHVVLFSGASLRIVDTPLGGIAAILPLGVDVLFIISGFVVFLPTVVRGGDLGDVRGYALRRAARLVPAYWLVLALVAVLFVLAPPSDPVYFDFGRSLAPPSAAEVLGHLAFLQAPIQLFAADSPFGFGVNGPVWTLSVEIGFYIVMPLIAGAYYRHPLRGLLIAAALTTGWHLFFADFASFSSLFGLESGSAREALVVLSSDYQLPAWAFSFGAGMTAAWLYVRLRARPDQAALCHAASLAQPAALLTVAAAAYLSYRYGIAGTGPDEIAGTAGVGRRAPLVGLLFTASVAALILSTAFARPWQQFVVANRFSRWLADISYGIYLIHFVVLAYLVITSAPLQTGTLGSFLLWAAISISISIAYGYLSARWLERPIRRWAQRYGRRDSRSA